MSIKKKIALGILSALAVFFIYEIGDWNLNGHWIGTTKETEIVQQHLLPLDEYFPEGNWYVECGDTPEDYFEVWTDFGLFGTHPTLGSGECGATSNIVVDDNGEYINTKIIPWLKEQGFSEVVIEGDVDGDYFYFLEPAKKMIDVSAGHQGDNNRGDKVQISFYIYPRTDSGNGLQSDKVTIYVKVVYRYTSSES